jgi:hypothetical protein
LDCVLCMLIGIFKVNLHQHRERQLRQPFLRYCLKGGWSGKGWVLGAFGGCRVVEFTKSFREVGGGQIRALALVWGHKP